jgi:dTDP-4-amino-4,6-dideoxygalactose transaminase
MSSFLKCPPISIEKLAEYVNISNSHRHFSNFGHCERLLNCRLCNSLDVPLDRTFLGASATSLLNLTIKAAFSEVENQKVKLLLPAFSFFSTFSLATDFKSNILWFDVDESFFPILPRHDIQPTDLMLLNIPFGSSRVLDYFEFIRELPCKVVIDAAACLPGIIQKRISLSDIPNNAAIIFSLHATKMLNTGEGGFCIFGKDFPDHMKKLTNFGIDVGRKQKWLQSTNSKMSEFNAAAGLASLDDFEENAGLVLKAKQTIKDISARYGLQFFYDVDEPTLTLNVVVKNPEEIIERLVHNGFETRRWWSMSPFIQKEVFPQSLYFYRTTIGLPFDWEQKLDYFQKIIKLVSR